MCLLTLAGCAPTVEYLYAHRVTGIVVDRDGHPVAHAKVARVGEADRPLGGPIYEAVTDDAGHFEFSYRGYGGPNRASDTWILVAEAGSGGALPALPVGGRKPGNRARATVLAPWQCSQDCPGYHADVVLRLPQ
jgi:hypothetical protein